MKEYKNLSKKYTIIIASISLLIFILGVGLTYAWFSATVSGNDSSTENVIENATLSIKYTNSNELNGENIIPGWSETKTFAVENTGTETTTYNIAWANLLNEFINKEDLVYTLTSNNNGGNLTETQLPETGENINILENITIEPNVIQTYTLTVTYKNQDKDQTSDTNKRLLGKIEVKDSNSVQPEEYKIDYILNGGVLENPITSYTIESEDIIIPEPSKEGYIFNGWTTEENTTPEKNITIPKGSHGAKTFTAEYSPITYQIKYNSNGGSGSMSNSSFTYDENKNLSKNTFTKEGYNFLGWSTSSNATEATYRDEQEVSNLTNTNNEIVNLYAVWKIKEYTVNTTVLNGTINGETSKQVAHGNNTTFSLNPSNSNYTDATYYCNDGKSKYSFNNNTLTVNEVKEETTCVVEYYIPTSTACFAFDSTTGTITNYYDYQGGGTSGTPCPRDVNIPSKINGVSVKNIGEKTFYQKQLTSVKIPSSITAIGHAAFAGNQLTAVEIPTSVTTIGEAAFWDNQLTTIIIPGSVTNLGSAAFTGNQLSEEQAFIYERNSDGSEDKTILNSYAGAKRSEVVIPDGVTTIGYAAFAANQLTTVEISSSVTEIGEGAFSDNQLTTLEIPTGVTTIARNAFYDNQLTSITLSSELTTIGENAFYNNNLLSLTIGNKVTTIGDGAFAENQLTTLTIPDSVTTIGKNVFYNNNLLSLTIGNKVTTIGDGAFAENQLTTLTIPDSVTTIGINTFYNNNLSSLTIGNKVAIIGDGAFYNNKISNLSLGANLISIGKIAFANNQLTSVTIPDNVTTIGDSAFWSNNLISVILGVGVTSMGEGSFSVWDNSNPNLTHIVNKTGRAFDWKYVTSGISDNYFVTGSFKTSTGKTLTVSAS